jgi:DHA1 family inner membrane transport protein
MTTDASRGVFIILSACNFVIGMGAFALIGMVEPLAEGLGVPVTAAASLLTVYAVGFAISSPVLVALTGRMGRRRVLALGMAVFGVTSLAAAAAPDLAVLYPLRVLAAMGAGLVTPVTLAIAAALAPPEGRGRALSAVFFGLTVSQVLGVPAGGWLAYTFGWRVVFVLVAALVVPCVWLVWTRVPAGLRFAPVSLRDLGRTLLDGVAMATVGFTVVFMGAIYALYTYLSPLLSQTMGFGRDGVALALLVFGLGAPLGNLVGGWMADRLGPVRSLIGVCLVQIAILPLFALLPLPVTGLFGLIFAWSLVGWAFSPSQQLRLVQLDPARAPVLMSLHAASIYVGIAAGSAAGGVVVAHAGLSMAGPVAGALALAALGVLLCSHRAAALRRAG